MDLMCLDCGELYEGRIDYVDGFWRKKCPNCGEPGIEPMSESKIRMAFTDPVHGDEMPYKYMTDHFEGRGITHIFNFSSEKEFLKKWFDLFRRPMGMWYWVLYRKNLGEDYKLICSGAVDPGDIEIFVEQMDFGLKRPIEEYNQLTDIVYEITGE